MKSLVVKIRSNARRVSLAAMLLLWLGGSWAFMCSERIDNSTWKLGMLEYYSVRQFYDSQGGLAEERQFSGFRFTVSIVLLLAVWPTLLPCARRFGLWLCGQDYCFYCGYDLRGSGERCPECGRTVIATLRCL